MIFNHREPHDGKLAIVDIVRDAHAFAQGREKHLPEIERTISVNLPDERGSGTLNQELT